MTFATQVHGSGPGLLLSHAAMAASTPMALESSV